MTFVFYRNLKISIFNTPAVASGVLLLSSLLLSGCPRPTSVPAKAPPLPEGQLPTITVVAGGSESYWNEAKRGAEAAGKALNAKIIWKVPSGKDEDALVKSQRKLMEDAIKVSQGVVAAPVDSTKMMRSFRAVAIAGLPVVAYARDVYSIQNKLSFVHNDDYQTGVLAAQEIKKFLTARDEALLFAATDGVQIDERVRAFDETLAKQRSDVRIVKVDSFAVGTKSQVAFIADENANYKSTLQLANSLKVIAFGADNDLKRAVASGQIAALISPDYFKMGYQSVKAILDFRKLNYPPREIKIAPRLITKESIKTSTQSKTKSN